MSMRGLTKKRSKQQKPVSVVLEHKPRIGLTGGYDLDDDMDKKPAAIRKIQSTTIRNGSVPLCSKFHEPGHLRPTNKKCRYYKSRESNRKGESTKDPLVVDAPAEKTMQMADEIDELDKMSLNDSGSSGFYSVAFEFSDGSNNNI